MDNPKQQRQMLEFVHDANVERFQLLLAQATDRRQQETLRKLIAEEKARWQAPKPQERRGV